MAGKTKLGRNPFSKKNAPAKPRAKSAAEERARPGNLSAPWSRPWALMENFTKTVRFISFDAPIGICFLTFQACAQSLRSMSRSGRP